MIERVETILKALRVVYCFGRPCDPIEFAAQNWPGSSGLRKPARTSRSGLTHGACMRSAAGAFLGRLRAAGLVEKIGHRWQLTPAGLEFLLREGRPVSHPVFPLLHRFPFTVQVDGSETHLYTDGHCRFTWNGRAYIQFFGPIV